MLHVVGGDFLQRHHLLEGADGHGAAVGQLQVALQGVALLLGAGGDVVDDLVHLGADVVILAHAVGLGLLGGHDLNGQLTGGVITEELVPGDVALIRDLQQHLGGVAHVLLVHGHRGVDAVEGAVTGVDDAVLDAIVIVVHLGGGIVLAVHGDGGGAALQHAGVHHHQQGGHQHEHHRDGAVQTVGLALLGLLLRLADGFGVLNTLAGQILAVLLFS